MNALARAARRVVRGIVLAACTLAAVGSPVRAQTAEGDIIRVPLPVGRSYPIHTDVPVTRVSVATPEIADVAVIGERDVVINSRAEGETDVLVWTAGTERRHYRVVVSPPTDRRQVSLGIVFAEVRRDALRELGISSRYLDKNARVGTGLLRSDNPIDPVTGNVTIPTDGSFLTVLTDFGTNDFLALLEAQETKGNARLLAQPNLMAANRKEANFLAGGEIPVPIATPGVGGQTFVTIQYREFGVRLRFTPDILSDSLITLAVRPEVSSLDFANAVTIAGFRIPALRTRRIESTVDVRPNQSLVISGLMSDEREKVRTGIPLLMDIPILGALFSSTRWQSAETELLVVVTPTLIDPMRPRQRDVLRTLPDTSLPAREALEGSRHPVLPRESGAPPMPPAR